MLYVREEEIPRDERHLVPFNKPRPLPHMLLRVDTADIPPELPERGETEFTPESE